MTEIKTRARSRTRMILDVVKRSVWTRVYKIGAASAILNIVMDVGFFVHTYALELWIYSHPDIESVEPWKWVADAIFWMFILYLCYTEFRKP